MCGLKTLHLYDSGLEAVRADSTRDERCRIAEESVGKVRAVASVGTKEVLLKRGAERRRCVVTGTKKGDLLAVWRNSK
jgi:hypothetical protein